MTDGECNPPGRAIWFLQHLCPGDNEALTGDLIEKFREGRNYGWLWRQVFIAFVVNVLIAIRRCWPCLCYAIAGTAMPALFWRAVPILLQWGPPPWRYRQISSIEVLGFPALAALPVFALALAINREFRWPIVFRTGVINLALMALGWWSLDVLDTFQSSLRPIADPRLMWLLTLPPALVRLLFFSIFLVSARLGRISSREPTQSPA